MAIHVNWLLYKYRYNNIVFNQASENQHGIGRRSRERQVGGAVRAGEGSMQPYGIRDSPLRTTKARKGRTRQASAIRSELLMTSLLSGALKTETEISFYLPRSALTGLSSSKGVPYDPIWLHLPSPAPDSPCAFPLPAPPPHSVLIFASLVKNNVMYRYLHKAKFT